MSQILSVLHVISKEEINKELENKPGLINKDPYGKGWIFKLKLKDTQELDSLLNVEEYEKSITSD